MSECRVLGAVRVFDAGGHRVTLVSQAQRRLLAMLCLRAHTVVRPVVLEEHLGLQPGRCALRSADCGGIGPEALVTESAGYELRATVDAAEYERLVNEAFLADAASARSCLEQAGALWEGPAYDEFAHEPWAEIEARRLTELHSAAIEELVSPARRREPTAAIATVLPLIDEQPYRDLPRALLMRALNVARRRTDALRQFQDYRRVLQERSAPSHRLRSWSSIGPLPRAGLRDARPDRASGVDTAAGPAAQGHGDDTSVRADPAELVRRTGVGDGRARSAPEDQPDRDPHRFWWVREVATGDARRIDRTRTDGTDAWWVDLGVLAPTADVAEQIATEIGVVPAPGRDRRARASVAGQAIAARARQRRTRARLHRRRPRGAVDEVPRGDALITSRQPLGLVGEVVWRVPELTMPDDTSPVTLDTFDRHDALRLFVVRGGRLDQEWWSTDRPRAHHLDLQGARRDAVGPRAGRGPAPKRVAAGRRRRNRRDHVVEGG